MSRRTTRPFRQVVAAPPRRPRVAASAQSARKRKSTAQRRLHAVTGPLPPVSLGGYPFPELTTQWTTIPHQAGLFAILERLPTVEGYRLLCLSEAADMHEAIATLRRRAALPKVSRTSLLVYAALATDVVSTARRQIIATLRTVYHLPTQPFPMLPPWPTAQPASSPLPPRPRRQSRTP